MATPKPQRTPEHAARNFGVEYVILYSFDSSSSSNASMNLQRLLRSLHNVGLDAAVRPGRGKNLLVLVRPREERLKLMAHRTRTKDWLYGIRTSQPTAADDLSDITEAERLRTIYEMITLPLADGGADVSPAHTDNVQSVFPLHDHELNKKWIREWSSKTLLSAGDIEGIRAKLGERMTFYFVFLQTYFRFLMGPAALGLACWVFGIGNFGVFYAVLNSLACLAFVEYWKRQEVDLRLAWEVKGVGGLERRRREFVSDRQEVDAGTGERVGVFPAWKRLARQLLVVPFTLAVVAALGTLIAGCFAIEVFINEIYAGPFKGYLTFVPTIILCLSVPTISAGLTGVAARLTAYENYETQAAHEAAQTQKVFVLNFVTSYLPVLLTAFVYVPFAPTLVPYLDVFQLAVRPLQHDEKATAAEMRGFSVNRDRLRKQVIYFTVTAQIVNFALETVVPYVKRRAIRTVRATTERSTSRRDGLLADVPEEAEFLERVRGESELADYDVTDDLREMVVQFGYLALFGPVWCLVPVSFLANNWVELRSDFVKICTEYKRPTPARADSIGPWLDSLSFLAWTGGMTSAALVYMFSGAGQGSAEEVSGWALLLTVFLSEQAYLLARGGVQTALAKLETEPTRRARAAQYLVRKRYLASTAGGEEVLEVEDGADVDEEEADPGRLTRASLEEDARRLSAADVGPAEVFWARQRGWKESARVGAVIVGETARTGRTEGEREAERKTQ